MKAKHIARDVDLTKSIEGKSNRLVKNCINLLLSTTIKKWYQVKVFNSSNKFKVEK